MSKPGNVVDSWSAFNTANSQKIKLKMFLYIDSHCLQCKCDQPTVYMRKSILNLYATARAHRWREKKKLCWDFARPTRHSLDILTRRHITACDKFISICYHGNGAHLRSASWCRILLSVFLIWTRSAEMEPGTFPPASLLSTAFPPDKRRSTLVASCLQREEITPENK